MSSRDMLDKRTADGTIISYKIALMTAKAANVLFKKFSSYKIYNNLDQNFHSKKLQILFERKIYNEVHPLIVDLVLINWSIDKKLKIENIYLSEDKIIFLKLLKEYFPEYKKEFEYFKIKEGIKFFLNKNPIIKIRETIKINRLRALNIREVLLNPLLLLAVLFQKKLFKNSNKHKKKSVLISYNEGTNIENRNDLFWFKSSKIPAKRIIIYFSDLNHLNKNDSFKNSIKTIEKLGINWCSLILNKETIKNFIPYSTKYFNKLLLSAYNSIHEIKISDEYEQWILKESRKLIENTNVWFNFFNHLNVAIHFDSSESDVINEKSLALDLLDAITISKERSSIVNHCGFYYGYYPNDVFFCNSKRTSNNFKRTNNFTENVIISGIPYPINITNINIESNLLKKEFSPKIKFILCILDNSHSYNKGHNQTIYTPYLEDFYENLFNLMEKFDDIGLIIKPKKDAHSISSISSINSKLENLIENKKVILIKDTIGKRPLAVALCSNLVVSMGVIFSNALIEAVSIGSRAIFLDYAFIKSYESDVYRWGKNKVIFNDKKILFKRLIDFKHNRESSLDFGDWSGRIKEYNYFEDWNGNKRIGNYVSDCLKMHDKLYEKDLILKEANKNYKNKWKII